MKSKRLYILSALILCAVTVLAVGCSSRETGGKIVPTQSKQEVRPVTKKTAEVTAEKSTEQPTAIATTTKAEKTKATQKAKKTVKSDKSPKPGASEKIMTDEEYEAMLAKVIEEARSHNKPQNYTVKYCEELLGKNKSKLQSVFDKVKAVKNCHWIFLSEDGDIRYLDKEFLEVKPSNPISADYINETAKYMKKNGFRELEYTDGYMIIRYEHEFLGPDMIHVNGSTVEIRSSWHVKYHLLYDPKGTFDDYPALIKELEPGWYMVKDGFCAPKDLKAHFTEEELETCMMITDGKRVPAKEVK